MKVNAIFNIWDDDKQVHGQKLGCEVPGLNISLDPLAKASSQLIYSIDKAFEKAMLKKFSIEQLENLINLAEEVMIDKIASGDERDNIPLAAEELPTECLIDDTLPKQETFEIVENYIEYHCRLAQEMLQEAANDSLTQKTTGPYVKDLALLLEFKELNSGLLYSRFMEDAE